MPRPTLKLEKISLFALFTSKKKDQKVNQHGLSKVEKLGSSMNMSLKVKRSLEINHSKNKSEPTGGQGNL